MTLRIGLVGAGANTRERHIPGFRAIPGVEIVSVANRTPGSSRRVAEEFGIPKVASSPEELIADPEVDAVCIGTWPYMHREYTIRALEEGKHVLCEARMAADAEEAEEMLRVSEAYPHLVAQIVPAPFDFRLGPTITRMVREKALGEIVEATVTLLNGSGLNPETALHWRQRSDYSGRNIMMLGIFAEIMQRWLGEARRVVADGTIVVSERRDPETGEPRTVDVPDTFSCAAELRGGERVTYHLSSMAQGAPWNGIVLFGTEGTLRWTMNDRAEWARHGEAFAPIDPDAGTDRGWRVEQDFVDSITAGAPVRLTNFSDGVRYMRFVDAAWRSWREGRAFEIEAL
ncbi:MAG: Gfo/Idh/MocA family oxidoreductase [Dehalococcoidia bacterium]|nr:Gfo/Idh/MocA family oxidoreductase [Dehalococcoidia bacterium]